jgi:hypothetical protein
MTLRVFILRASSVERVVVGRDVPAVPDLVIAAH